MTHPIRAALPLLLLLGACWEYPVAWEDTTASATATPTGTATAAAEVCFDGIDQDLDGFDNCTVASALASYAGRTGEGLGRVGTPGDLDGDGFEELSMGAEGASFAGKSNAGATYVFAATTGAYNLTAPSLSLYGASANGVASQSAAAGDINGDGPGDLLIGAVGEASPETEGFGRAHLFCGRSPLPETEGLTQEFTDATFNAGSGVSGLGHALAGGGDFNGDGKPDMVISAFDDNLGFGQVFILYGGDTWCAGHLEVTLPDDADVVIFSSEADGQPGGTLAFLPDIDGDGSDELLIGAPGKSGSFEPGEVHLLFGEPLARGTQVDLEDVGGLALINYTDGTSRSRFGASISAGGDLNGDGKPDFVVGAPGPLGQSGDGDGAVYTITSIRRPVSPEHVILPEPGSPALTTGFSGGNFGASVALLPDFNGDGRDDLVAGAPGADAYGLIEIHMPFNVGGQIPPIRIEGIDLGGGFGSFVAGLDPDGDQRPAPTLLLVGAPRGGSTQDGVAYLFGAPKGEGAGAPQRPR